MNAWLFDVDGVITDPQAKQVTSPKIIDAIIEKLSQKEPVGLITGRSINWLEERVLHYFRAKAKDNLSYFFVSAEKGGVYGGFDENGNLKLSIDKKLDVPEDVKKEIENIINKNFSSTVFFDPKKTMATVEVQDGVAIEELKKIQPRLDQLIAGILKKSNLQKTFKLQSLRISTDVEHKTAGKNLAAKRFLDWLNAKRINATKFFAFGDDFPDVAMAQELYKNGHDVTFVFVGGKNILKGKYPFQVVITKSLFTGGVIEFLSQHQST